MKITYCRYFIVILTLFLPLCAGADLAPSKITQVVMLGTGTPFADPKRSGPAVAIVVHDEAYIVDFGPGIVRRASAMTPRYGGNMQGLKPSRLKHAFLTHLHSDHTAGFADLILTPWTLDRDEPLVVYGPEGITEMVDHLLVAYREDIRYRVYGAEPTNNEGWRVNSHVIKPGNIYQDENITVTAFKVKHGSWPNAFGFRFVTPDRTIVISGDTTLDSNVEKFAANADLLIHEVYSDAGLAKRSEFWKHYHASNHTSASELGQLASRVKPGLLVLTHALFFGSTEDTLLSEVKAQYSGDVVLANDLDVY